MGKRKSSKKPVAKKARPKLEKTFNCPFCNAHGSVECRVDRAGKTGTLACGVCDAKYATVADDLTEECDLCVLFFIFFLASFAETPSLVPPLSPLAHKNASLRLLFPYTQLRRLDRRVRGSQQEGGGRAGGGGGGGSGAGTGARPAGGRGGGG
jgi:transcription elongation factor Elf1